MTNRNTPTALMILLWLIFSSPSLAEQSATEEIHTKAAMLNNEGVGAINNGNCQLAIEKFTRALELEPTYDLAHENLAMAHNNYGIALANNPAEALKQFHEAAYLRMNTRQTSDNLGNLDSIIRVLGKDPKRFSDRLKLGDEASAKADPHGAIVEYYAALRLQADPQIHKKIGDIYEQLGQNDKAKAEYEAGRKGGTAK